MKNDEIKEEIKSKLDIVDLPSIHLSRKHTFDNKRTTRCNSYDSFETKKKEEN